jgi:hypothetical protein
LLSNASNLYRYNKKRKATPPESLADDYASAELSTSGDSGSSVEASVNKAALAGASNNDNKSKHDNNGNDDSRFFDRYSRNFANRLLLDSDDDDTNNNSVNNNISGSSSGSDDGTGNGENDENRRGCAYPMPSSDGNQHSSGGSGGSMVSALEDSPLAVRLAALFTTLFYTQSTVPLITASI